MAGKLPDPKELEKELNDYLTKKYGDRVRLATPMVIPQKDEGLIDKESREDKTVEKGALRFKTGGIRGIPE